jgi:hypothetical protein
LLDFEGTVSSYTRFSGWVNNHVRGQVGEGPIAMNQEVSMMWEVGKSDLNGQIAKHCNFDESHCYEAFNVPSIYTVSSNTGYTTGGQILTVTGHGFNNIKVSA